jgi:activator of HSP90 ATPase
MSGREDQDSLANSSTRRQLISGTAVALGLLGLGARAWGSGQQPTTKGVPGASTNQTRTSLHQEVRFKASAQFIFEALLSSKQFAEFSGAPAQIDPKAGGAFSLFGGMIVGRNVELVPSQRIVQAWRPAHWNPGVYSLVRFALQPSGSGTLVVLDHTGFPEGDFDSLSSGWKLHYWDGLEKSLAPSADAPK